MKNYIFLFDLGGVLIDFDGKRFLEDVSGGTISNEAKNKFWLESPWVRKFETGNCRPIDFAKGVIQELNLSISANDFISYYKKWLHGFYDGALDLLTEIKKTYPVFCLSNNNELHWNILMSEYGISSIFEKCYASYKLGVMKPDKRIFEYVISDLSVDPHNIFFFDDKKEYVQGALDAKLQAFHVSGIKSLKEALKTILN